MSHKMRKGENIHISLYHTTAPKEGCYMGIAIHAEELAEWLRELCEAEITAEAHDEDGNEVGAVWQVQGETHSYCEGIEEVKQGVLNGLF